MVLKIHTISKSFGKNEILKDIFFSCKTGEITGLFGRNGCGKSTLLKIIYGTLKANRCVMSIDGKAIHPSEVIPKKLIAYLPQHRFLPKVPRVRDIIPVYYSSEEKQDAIFYDPLIAQISAKRVSELSIGQLRYFQVLLIGYLEHKFIMFDEPFSMIDPLYKEKISELLIKIKQRKGIILTDHYYNDVLDITNQNLLIKSGNIHKVNSKEELIKLKYLSKPPSSS